MNYDQWINRPVYRVQVTTARELLRMYKLDPRAALATSGDHPIAHFRVRPQYRTPTSLALRKLVADRMRELRRQHGRGAVIPHIDAWK